MTIVGLAVAITPFSHPDKLPQRVLDLIGVSGVAFGRLSRALVINRGCYQGKHSAMVFCTFTKYVLKVVAVNRRINLR